MPTQRFNEARFGSLEKVVCALTLCSLVFHAAYTESAVAQGSDLPDLTLVETLRIDGGSTENFVLSSVANVLERPDGRIFVLQPEEKLVRVFDSSGTEVGTIGREGRGPGEFTWPLGLGTDGDRLWVWDSGLNRLIFFTFDGELESSQNLPYPGEPAILTGEFVVMSSRTTGELVRFRTGSSRPEPFATLPQFASPDPMAVPVAGGYATVRQPFSERAFWRSTPDWRTVVIVHREEGAASPAFRVSHLDFSGDTLFSRLYEYSLVRPNERLVEAVVEKIQSNIERGGRGRVAPGSIRRQIDVPPYLAPVTSVKVGSDGAIWMRREDRADGEVDWMILDRNGEAVGVVELPSDVQVHGVSLTSAWVASESELGAPILTRYEVRR